MSSGHCSAAGLTSTELADMTWTMETGASLLIRKGPAWHEGFLDGIKLNHSCQVWYFSDVKNPCVYCEDLNTVSIQTRGL